MFRVAIAGAFAASLEPPVRRRLTTPREIVVAGKAVGERHAIAVFYGWVLVGVSVVTMAIDVNARTAFSLLFPPILHEFQWDRGVTAGAFSAGFLCRRRRRLATSTPIGRQNG
jgi:hypothetical protein